MTNITKVWQQCLTGIPVYKAISKIAELHARDGLWAELDDVIALGEIIVHKYMPSGSGIDNGVTILWDKCRENKLVFSFDFHHMDGNGYYINWTTHSLIVTPSFRQSFELKFKSKDYQKLKEALEKENEKAILRECGDLESDEADLYAEELTYLEDYEEFSWAAFADRFDAALEKLVYFDD